MASRTTARIRRTVGVLVVLCFATDANAQVSDAEPQAASAEVLLYLAEFEADADPVELSELETEDLRVESSDAPRLPQRAEQTEVSRDPQ